jgi:ABC-type transporter Mla MlaB component
MSPHSRRPNADSLTTATTALLATKRGAPKAAQLRKALFKRAVKQIPRVVVDLAALEFLACCALGVLIRVRALAQQADGDLLLAAASQQVRRILALTLPGSKTRSIPVTWGDRQGIAMGHDDQPCLFACSTGSSSGSAAG